MLHTSTFVFAEGGFFQRKKEERGRKEEVTENTHRPSRRKAKREPEAPKNRF